MKEIEELTLFFKELKNSWWKLDKFQVKIGRKLKEEGSGEKERRGKENKKERKKRRDGKRKKESKVKRKAIRERQKKWTCGRYFGQMATCFKLFFFYYNI